MKTRSHILLIVLFVFLSSAYIAGFSYAEEAEPADDGITATPEGTLVDEGGFVVGDSAEEIDRSIQPALQVLIPGGDLNGSVIVGDGDNGCNEGYVCSWAVERYLNLMFKWGSGAAIVFTIVIIMLGGLQYAIGSTVGQTSKGMERMKNAAAGLILVLFVNLILTFVNPSITQLKPFELTIIKPVHDISAATLLGGFAVDINRLHDGKLVKEGTEYLLMHGEHGVHEDILVPLQRVAAQLYKLTGKKLVVASAYRSATEQASLFYQNCIGRKICDTGTCDPLPRDASSPVQGCHDESKVCELKPTYASTYETPDEQIDFLKKAAFTNEKQACPHLTGYTVDIWCYPNPPGFVDDAKCHMQLEELMRSAGFGRITNEAWHFEWAQKAHTKVTQDQSWITGKTRISSDKCAKYDVPSGIVLNGGEEEKCVFDYSVCPGDFHAKNGICL